MRRGDDELSVELATLELEKVEKRVQSALKSPNREIVYYYT